MKIIAVDDERLALESLVATIRRAAPEAEIEGFRSGEEALEAARRNQPDIAFLDIEMRGMNGMALAQTLSKECPKINLIFTTGYSSYTQQAFAVHASGYILKPVTPDKVRAELECLRYGVPAPEQTSRPKLTVRAFGDFEAYVNGVPIHFSYARSKEVLAFLVDRKGAMCSTRQIAAVLWEDAASSHASYLNNIRSDLLNTLEKCGCGDVLVLQRGAIAILPDKISCDYYDFLNADDSPSGQRARSTYRGEYMTQYSWAEITNSHLSFHDRRDS